MLTGGVLASPHAALSDDEDPGWGYCIDRPDLGVTVVQCGDDLFMSYWPPATYAHIPGLAHD